MSKTYSLEEWYRLNIKRAILAKNDEKLKLYKKLIRMLKNSK